MKIGKFELVNSWKVDRMLNGTPTQGGLATGGVGKKATDAEKLAEYDRLAGLIRVGTRKVKTGSFWDFKEGKARSEPEVVFEVRGVDGKVYEIADGEEAPIEVQVAEKNADEKSDEDADEAVEAGVKKPAAKAKKPASKKGKKSVEDEE